ncbi:MAG: hypothetical protein Q4F93_03345 [bacterium]|jgi:hypothetical protein|nr:hypothetical protein [bacterium]
MKIFKVISICIIALIFTSCGSVSHNRSYSFDQVRLEMGMDDLEYVGDSEISVEYTSYLGLFKSVEKVNGEMYNPTHKKNLVMPKSCKFRNRNLDIAAYKLVETYPEAVYFQIVFETKNVEKLFLGSVNKEVAKVRAYKLKK